MEYGHKPVLLAECLEGLRIRPDGVYADATTGLGGHSYEIARRLTTGRLIAVDRDESSLQIAQARLAELPCRKDFYKSNYRDLAALPDLPPLDGILFDLGVSSPQFDDPERGFSYRFDAPLDMRMDQGQELTARRVVGEWPQSELVRILYAYGEEKFAPAIAAALVRRREKEPIETTGQLAEIIVSALPPAARRSEGHPAKKSFQAIRMAVNDELAGIEEGVRAAVSGLTPGGRIAVITFHSLEDRLVKTLFAEGAHGCDCPPDFPVCVCGKTPRLRLITKHPITASQDEQTENRRAHSAKLRVAEKI